METFPDSREVWTQVWFEQAKAGVIWIPKLVRLGWSQVIRMALYGLRDKDLVEVLIDCHGGDEASFDPCRELAWRREQRKDTHTVVLGEASSIGLSYAVCGTHRSAVSEAQFMAHGETLRDGRRHESGVYLEDHYIAAWLARFTNRSYADWLDYVSDGAEHWFGIAEALEWGVIDEVLEGV